MAQASKRSTSSSSRKSSSSKSRSNGSSSGSKKTSSRARSAGSSRARSAGSSRAKSAGSSTASRTKRAGASANGASAAAPAAAAKDAAVAGTKAAGKAVSTAASKVKTPLMVGGAAIAGVVGGAAIRSKIQSNRAGPVRKRLNGFHMPNMPKPGKAIDVAKLRKSVDFDRVADTAERVGSYGRQVGEVAGAVERASKAAKKGK
jgi:hypothetical protein